MKKLLNLALCSAIAFCLSTVMAQNPNDNDGKFGTELNMSKPHSLGIVNVESVNINDQTKQPQEAQTGSTLIMKKGQYAVVNGTALIGEKNNDDNFNLQHYAKLYIQEKAKLNVNKGGILKIQKDGKLINSGELYLYDGSSLISPLINMSEGSVDFATNKKGDKRLKHGIDNENGIIVVNKGSKIYWDENNDGKKSKATIYKGTIDFERLFDGSNEYPSENDFIMNLEGAKIKLFDPTNETLKISKCALRNIKTFKNVYLGDNCVLDGEFDFSPSKSIVIKLSQRQAKSLSSELSTNTVVRKKGANSKFSEEVLKGLFENGDKLTINKKPYAGEQIDYSLKDLLEEFNKDDKGNKATILNTNYTDIFENNDSCKEKLVKTLTNDWDNTIDKNILPLYNDQFTQIDGSNNSSYNMYFKFEGNKNISFELQDNTKDSSFYQMELYGDLAKYSPLLNEKLPSNSEEETNIVNKFIQKYNGASPYLKTNKNTKYTVDPTCKNGNVTLRFAKNENENTPIKYASLNNLVIGTTNNSASVEIDYSYNSENTPNYAQTLAVGMLKMCNKDSQLTLKAGQTLVFGTTNIDDMNINEILEDDYEWVQQVDEQNPNIEDKNNDKETDSSKSVNDCDNNKNEDKDKSKDNDSKKENTNVNSLDEQKNDKVNQESVVKEEDVNKNKITAQKAKIEIVEPEINDNKIETKLQKLLDVSEYSDDVIEQSKYSVATEHPSRYYNENKQNVHENIINVNLENVIGKTEDKNKAEQEDDSDDWD